MDQGWTGTFIAEDQRKAFIRKLHCDYGTSGGLWVYHCGRWDRLSYFLPYLQRACRRDPATLRRRAPGCMFYQGPVINPGVEANIAVGGRTLANTRRSVEDALSEVIALDYRPRDLATQKRLVEVFLRAEDAYFGRSVPANSPRRAEPCRASCI